MKTLRGNKKCLPALMEYCSLVRAMSAHNPMCALLAEQAGFEAIWASGFEISASYGLPDASLITHTQHLEITRAICTQVQIPVIADVDTGYGNAVNVVYACQTYEDAGAAAIVIEDKTFPKDSSLRPNGRQQLLDVGEFEGKVAAAVDARRSKEFLIIARTEALIAGAGMDDALHRAACYEAAGADAILVHSKQSDPEEILTFSTAWEGRAPLVVVPTAYPQLTESDIVASKNIAIVIYGNHSIRAAVAAMQSVYAQIAKEGGILNVEKNIASVQRIFDLQGTQELTEIESSYLR